MVDKRKLKILEAIVKSHIETGEPVGSRNLSKNFDLGVSSATIRNEMADLEELGYLLQPHTSAGRIPSDLGYRLYVNEMLPKIDLELNEGIESDFTKNFNHLNDLLKYTVGVLSKTTNYISVAITSISKITIIEKIELIKLGNTTIMLILIPRVGTARNKTMRVKKDITDEELRVLIEYLNKKYKGIEKENIDGEILGEIYKLLNDQKCSKKYIKDVINEILSLQDEALFFEGLSNIFSYPEYGDTERAREFLRLIEDKDKLKETIDIQTDEPSGIVVKIGNENIQEELKRSSIITAVYTLDGNIVGKIAVLGPTRMNYLKVIATMKSVSNQINHIIKNHLID